jgi:hypothetical protein
MVRGVWVVRLVAELVVPAVHGDPRQHRPLDGHRTEDGQDELDHPVGLKAPVREQAVEPDSYPQAGQGVHAYQQAQVDPAKAPAPCEVDRGDETEKRHDDRRQVPQLRPERVPLADALTG